MGLLRRDERGGLQLPEQMGDFPNIGVLTSERMELLKLHDADDEALRVARAREKLRSWQKLRAHKRRLARRPQRDALCDTCNDAGEIVAHDAQGNVIGNVECPDCQGTGGGGFSGSAV